MDTARPGQTTTITQDGIPSGAAVGFQVIKAANGLVAIARTNAGVSNIPAGTSSYTISFTAPIEIDLYLMVIDWTGGVLDELAIVRDLRVVSVAEAGDSGMGAIADYAKAHMGGETWNRLTTHPLYGEAFVSQSIGVVKDRIFTSPPTTEDEGEFPRIVLDYLGICAALQLIPAARDLWMQEEISRTIGHDPSETVTYINRAAMMDSLREDLMRLYGEAQRSALPFIQQPVLRSAGDGPAIDEPCDTKVTRDPRDFDLAALSGGPLPADAWGYGVPRRSGARL